MKILVLTPRFPFPPHRGDTLRVWKQIEHLGRRHDVWLAALAARPPNPNHRDHVATICRALAVIPHPPRRAWRRGLAGFARGQSLLASFFQSPALAHQVAAWHQAFKFDSVLTFTVVMQPHTPRDPHVRRVLDMCDVDSEKLRAYARRSRGPLAWAYRTEARRFEHHEQAAAEASDVTLLVNERERQKLIRRHDLPNTAVLPTCVVRPTPGAAALPAQPVVGLIGALCYPPNVRGIIWFARHVWPLVRSACPTAEWWLVGRDPTRAVQQLDRAPGVRVIGAVPEMLPYLRRMRVVVNPVRGDLGVQSKTLMALAAGKASVVTPEVAGGIPYGDGDAPFLVESIPDRFARATVKLLQDDARARALGRRGQAVITERFDPATHFERLERWLAGTPDEVPPGRFVSAPPTTASSASATPLQPVVA
jgi:polysaccharide biosynthesis protein PslH